MGAKGVVERARLCSSGLRTHSRQAACTHMLLFAEGFF